MLLQMPTKANKKPNLSAQAENAAHSDHAYPAIAKRIKVAPSSNETTVPASREATIAFILANGGRSSDQIDPPRIDPRRPPGRVNGNPQTPRLRFIDLFCGIGGFRLAFERAGAQCVFSSDWDKFSRQTYAANFGEQPAGDINAIPVGDFRSGTHYPQNIISLW